MYVHFTARKIISDISSSEINARINDIINESNEIMLSKSVFYSDYFELEKDTSGKVCAVIANTGLINQMTLIWNTEIQIRLNELRSFELVLPAGTLTGNAWLSQFGTSVTIRAEVISNCAITYKSVFLQAGINQILHRLILNTEITAEIVIPSNSENIIVSQEIILAETIIPGSVPQSYLVGENSLQYLDLLAK